MEVRQICSLSRDCSMLSVPPDGGPPDRGSSDGGPPDLLSVTGLLNAERPTYQCERESLNFNSIPLNHTSLVNRCWCRFCKYLPATPEAVKLTYQCERESLNFNSIPLNHTSLVNRCWCRFCKYLPATPEAVKLTETLLGVAEE
jgi:hypothetical protein